MQKDGADALRGALRQAIEASPGMTATSLGKKVRNEGSYFRDFLSGRKASVGASEISAAEKILELQPGALLRFVTAAPDARQQARSSEVEDLPEAEVDPRAGLRDVPVMGVTAGGSDGEFQLNGDVVDYVRRLPGIARTKGVFALHVISESMVPRYEPGELVYANPNRPPAGGDFVVVELQPLEGERNGPSFIKRLVRRTGAKIVCEQFNPPKQIEYDSREVKAIYRILPLHELVGF